MTGRIPAAALLLVLACLRPAAGQTATGDTSLVKAVLGGVNREPKPAKFESFTQRIDYIHSNLYNDYNTRVARTDLYFGRRLISRESPVPSRFRCGLYAEISQQDETEFAFQPAFEAQIRLPNLEKEWNVFIRSARPTDLPSRDPTERNKNLQVGVATLIERMHVSANTGVRLKWLPSAFAELTWQPSWRLCRWNILPSQSVFYETDDGLGEQTQMIIHRWFGERQRWAMGLISAGTWSESTEGLEWEQTVKGGHIRELINEKDRGTVIGGSDIARGTGLGYSMFGSDTIVTEHQVMLVHRLPIHRQWVYLEVSPGIRWLNESDWRTDPFVLFGLDIFFWGTPSR